MRWVWSILCILLLEVVNLYRVRCNHYYYASDMPDLSCDNSIQLQDYWTLGLYGIRLLNRECNVLLSEGIGHYGREREPFMRVNRESKNLILIWITSSRDYCEEPDGQSLSMMCCWGLLSGLGLSFTVTDSFGEQFADWLITDSYISPNFLAHSSWKTFFSNTFSQISSDWLRIRWIFYWYVLKGVYCVP